MSLFFAQAIHLSAQRLSIVEPSFICKKKESIIWHSRWCPLFLIDLVLSEDVKRRTEIWENIRKMAIRWTIPLTLVFFLAVVQARPPGLYWPTGAEEHKVQTRPHLDDGVLNGLNENELETLLYLLDKVDRPRVVPNRQQQEQFTYAHPSFGEARNKRTGHHALPKKKAVDWSDYLGIDKREVKEPIETEVAMVPPSALPDAKDDKEREEIMKEFYANMAMAANVKRRKRAVRPHTIDKDMSKVGENLIWDALKMTGAHRDDKMSKDEFKQLKKELIRRIGAAYDLEKLRHLLEGNVTKFGGNKNHVGQ